MKISEAIMAYYKTFPNLENNFIDKIKLPTNYAWGRQCEQKLGNFFRALHTQVVGYEDLGDFILDGNRKMHVPPSVEMEELVERLTIEDAKIFQKVYKKYPAKEVSKLVNGLNI